MSFPQIRVFFVINDNQSVSLRLVDACNAQFLEHFSTWSRHGGSLFGKKNEFGHTKQDEIQFGQDALERYTGKRIYNQKKKTESTQWTTKFGELGIKLVLELGLGRSLEYQSSTKGCRPDLYDPKEDTFYEVKTQSYSIPGTAGEKIFAVPFKYKKLGKKVVVVLAGSLETKYRGLLSQETKDDADTVKILKEHCNTMFCGASDLVARLH